MTRREQYGLAALVLVVLLAYSLIRERQPVQTVEQAVAHERTTQAETVFVERKAAAVVAKVSYRTLRDTVLKTLTDTQLVKETLLRADTTIVRDSTALAAAEKVIASKDAELQIALKPHPAPRLTFTVAGLYDPLTGTPAVSGGASLRVIGHAALVARADLRTAIGERPRTYVGVAFTF